MIEHWRGGAENYASQFENSVTHSHCSQCRRNHVVSSGSHKLATFGGQLDQKCVRNPHDDCDGQHHQQASATEIDRKQSVHDLSLRLLLRRCDQSRAGITFRHPAFDIDYQHADEEQEDHGEADGADELLQAHAEALTATKHFYKGYDHLSAIERIDREEVEDADGDAEQRGERDHLGKA